MHKSFSRFLFAGLALSAALISRAGATATEFASAVVSYNPGDATTTDPTLTDSSAALGAPTGIVGVGSGYPGVLSPFNPGFQSSEIVVIGEGGEITLQFPEPVIVGTGKSIGVFSNAGLVDTDYPDGTVGSPATTFGGGSAKVRVSEDGTHWVLLGAREFTNPSNYYVNAGPYDVTAPSSPVDANFGQPFLGLPTSFSGDDYASVISTLDGSGGGRWLDLSPTGLSEINYIRFTVPGDGTDFAGTVGTRMVIDAVAVADSHVEPSVQVDSITASPSVVGSVPLPSAFWLSMVGISAIVVGRFVVRRARAS
jgi:hypothetical protein